MSLKSHTRKLLGLPNIRVHLVPASNSKVHKSCCHSVQCRRTGQAASIVMVLCMCVSICLCVVQILCVCVCVWIHTPLCLCVEVRGGHQCLLAFYILLFIVCVVCMCAHGWSSTLVEVRRQLVGASFLLLSCGHQGLTSGH